MMRVSLRGCATAGAQCGPGAPRRTPCSWPPVRSVRRGTARGHPSAAGRPRHSARSPTMLLGSPRSFRLNATNFVCATGYGKKSNPSTSKRYDGKTIPSKFARLSICLRHFSTPSLHLKPCAGNRQSLGYASGRLWICQLTTLNGMLALLKATKISPDYFLDVSGQFLRAFVRLHDEAVAKLAALSDTQQRGTEAKGTPSAESAGEAAARRS